MRVLEGRARGDGDCGLDLLVLTGGVGEHSCEVRTTLADGLAHLGVAVDDRRNRSTTG